MSALLEGWVDPQLFAPSSAGPGSRRRIFDTATTFHAFHELEHIRMFRLRMESIVLVAKSWDDSFETKAEAQSAMVKYQNALDAMIEARKWLESHDQTPLGKLYPEDAEFDEKRGNLRRSPAAGEPFDFDSKQSKQEEYKRKEAKWMQEQDILNRRFRE